MTAIATASKAREDRISIALGDYAHTRQLKAATGSLGSVPVDFAEVKPINRAFAPMVRELRFDIAELAIATFLQAKAYGCPLVLLPVATACRFQEGALLCRAYDRSLASVVDLRGKRVGVRAYSQTTAMWLRGILRDDYGIEPQDIRWIVFEGAHVLEFRDPSTVTRAPAGADLLAMLRGDELDAIIVGNDKLEDKDLRPVFPDLREAAERFWRTHGFEPVNHVVVARRTLVNERPDVAAAFLEAMQASFNAAAASSHDVPPLGRQCLQPSLALASRYATDQGLLPRSLSPEEIWDGLPQLSSRLGGIWL